MYLVGSLYSFKEEFDFDNLKVQLSITKEDLLRARRDSDYIIFNIYKLEAYHAGKNEWVKLEHK